MEVVEASSQSHYDAVAGVNESTADVKKDRRSMKNQNHLKNAEAEQSNEIWNWDFWWSK